LGTGCVPVRNPTGNGVDEDVNLKGPAASEEARPTSQLFETLKHREKDPDRVFPEVPRGSDRAQLGRDGTSVLSLRLWSRFVDAVKAYTAAARPRAMGRGTPQGGENPREPG